MRQVFVATNGKRKMYSKDQQTRKNKATKDLTDQEKDKYFSWIKENKGCAICGKFPEIHHLTNKTIKGKRRLHSRVIGLCFNHHSQQSEQLSIHGDTYKFYKEVMSLNHLLMLSNLMYQEYLSEKNIV